MFWKRFVDILLLFFFLLSIFYLLRNLLFSENGYRTIKHYRESIEGLKTILAKERERNRRLKEDYLFVTSHGNVSLQIFVRDYLWLVPPDEAVYLKDRKGEH